MASRSKRTRKHHRWGLSSRNRDYSTNLRHLRLEPLEPRWLLTTFWVTNTADSGAGSLRQAILDANSTPGYDEIRFAIASGAQTIQPLTALPTITDPVRLDATTQPGYAGHPIIELDGSLAGNANGLNITAGGTTVKGLVINRFSLNGILLSQGGGNVVQNNYIGTDLAGSVAQANKQVGVLVESASSNNLIGTDLTGTLALGNQSAGVRIESGAQRNRIGVVSSPVERNVISGNFSHGVWLLGSNTRSNVVAGNLIGTDATGSYAVGNSNGITIINSISNRIGGLGALGNTIAHHWDAGIEVTGATTRENRLLGNSIFANGGLAIDLGGDGPTENDPLDLDDGPNRL